jgi:type II secretory pathway component GspD/PulD (secretin)
LEEYSSASGATKENTNTNNNTNNDQEKEETRVQLPTMTMRGFMQEIAMRSGYTLVLTGFETVNDSTESSGIGKAKMGLLGGKAYNSNEHQVLVILITPEVLQSPLSQESLMRDY